MKHVVREIWFNCSAIAIAPNVLMNTRDITFIAPISSDPKVEDFYVCDDDGHIGIVKVDFSIQLTIYFCMIIY